MRIALFTDTFVPSLNGVARVLGLLVEHANRRGHEVGVVTPSIEDRSWPGTAFHLRLPGVELPFYREFKACLPHLGREERETLRAFDPHIVHLATEALVGFAGRSWARSAGVPTVTSYCTNFPEYMAGYRMGLLEEPVWRHLRRFHESAVLSSVRPRRPVPSWRSGDSTTASGSGAAAWTRPSSTPGSGAPPFVAPWLPTPTSS